MTFFVEWLHFFLVERLRKFFGDMLRDFCVERVHDFFCGQVA